MESELPIASVIMDNAIVVPVKPEYEEETSVYEICTVSWCILVIVIFYVLIIFPKGFTN